jgi:serine phosphatase RsbU (regulator of sigma subunit)
MGGPNEQDLETSADSGDSREAQRLAAAIGGFFARDGLRDPAIAWKVMPLQRVSGDAVAAQRTASGRLIALLADAAGHGLAAAASLVPALEAFYHAAARDLPLASIAREMNRSVRETERSDRFVAAVLAEVEADGRRLRVWNGGMPAGLWVRRAGAIPSAALRSRHLPLGILADDAFDPACTTLDTAGDGLIVFFSDGAIEAADPLGEPFGVPRLRQQMRGSSDPQEGLRRIVEALIAHVGRGGRQDDLALLVLRPG